MTNSSPSPRLLALAGLAVTAGREIMAIYAKPLTAREKADLTPVTEADEAAERIILAGLKSQDPDIPVISEEAAAAGFIPETGERFYLVDPLDGTKEFLSRNGEFTVNIALIDKGSPIAGVVLAPALGRLFCGETGAARSRRIWRRRPMSRLLPGTPSRRAWRHPMVRSSSPAARIATSALKPFSNA